jgi:hypothetical protein
MFTTGPVCFYRSVGSNLCGFAGVHLVFLLRHKILGALVSLKFSGSMLMDSNKIQGLESFYHILKV